MLAAQPKEPDEMEYIGVYLPEVFDTEFEKVHTRYISTNYMDGEKLVLSTNPEVVSEPYLLEQITGIDITK